MFYSELNVDDILRPDLMPTFFLANENTDVLKDSMERNTTPSTNGSIDAALSTLNFHRLVCTFWYFSENLII